MNYKVNFKNVHFSQWFYPTLKDLEDKWSLQHDRWIKYVHACTGKKFREEMKILSLTIMDCVGSEAWPLYIHAIDLFENKGWPKSTLIGGYDGRRNTLCMLAIDILSLCDENDFTDPKHHLNCILQISDKLRDSLVSSCYDCVGGWDILKLEKLKIINGPQQAKYFEKCIFEGLTRNNVMFIKLACEWLEKKWISPIKYESEICKFVNQEMNTVSYNANYDREILKPKLLHSIYRYPSVYRKAAALYDEQVRRCNLEAFKFYRYYGNDPSDFKGLPFADGSSMKPVRRWFSWKLE